MKKGISTFVAAVLLIGFTVAVGAILSVWFTTFTKTQTATVQAGAACVSVRLDVSAINLADGILTYTVTNSGPYNVNITTVAFSCEKGSWTNNTYSTSPVTVNAASFLILSENTIHAIGEACTEKGRVSIRVFGRCQEIGGTTEGICPAGTCFE